MAATSSAVRRQPSADPIPVRSVDRGECWLVDMAYSTTGCSWGLQALLCPVYLGFLLWSKMLATGGRRGETEFRVVSLRYLRNCLSYGRTERVVGIVGFVNRLAQKLSPIAV